MFFWRFPGSIEGYGDKGGIARRRRENFGGFYVSLDIILERFRRAEGLRKAWQSEKNRFSHPFLGSLEIDPVLPGVRNPPSQPPQLKL